MKRDEAFPSNFLKADDLKNAEGKSIAKRVTIAGVEDVKYPDGGSGRMLSFKETEKKLGLNKTNWTAIETITGKDDDENWVGEKIEIFRAMVAFKGETVPAIRVRPVGGWQTAPVEDENPTAFE